jgi:hypothetical protein
VGAEHREDRTRSWPRGSGSEPATTKGAKRPVRLGWSGGDLATRSDDQPSEYPQQVMVPSEETAGPGTLLTPSLPDQRVESRHRSAHLTQARQAVSPSDAGVRLEPSVRGEALKAFVPRGTSGAQNSGRLVGTPTRRGYRSGHNSTWRSTW